MNEKSTYRALAFVDGGYQQRVTLEVDEDGATVRRVFRIGHVTEEPIAYQYVTEEHDPMAQPDVPN
jgi:hypothetical protein